MPPQGTSTCPGSYLCARKSRWLTVLENNGQDTKSSQFGTIFHYKVVEGPCKSEHYGPCCINNDFRLISFFRPRIGEARGFTRGRHESRSFRGDQVERA